MVNLEFMYGGRNRSLSFPALVESVRDGSSLRARLFMPDGDHQIVNIALAGVRCPKTASKSGEPSEQWAEEVRLQIFLAHGRNSHLYPAGEILHRITSTPTSGSHNYFIVTKFYGHTVPDWRQPSSPCYCINLHWVR